MGKLNQFWDEFGNDQARWLTMLDETDWNRMVWVTPYMLFGDVLDIFRHGDDDDNADQKSSATKGRVKVLNKVSLKGSYVPLFGAVKKDVKVEYTNTVEFIAVAGLGIPVG